MPRITIVMPCFNAEAHLGRSVGSVLAQTFADWNLVIVNDGSTDGSPQLLHRLAEDEPRIRIVHQPNCGVTAARNRGLGAAHAELTAFLDADDTWHPDLLSEMVSTLDAHPAAGLAYCGWQNLGLGGGRDEPFVPPDYENGSKLEHLLVSCRWPIHAAVVRSALVDEAGGFDETLGAAEDFDLWLRIGTVYPLVRVPRVLAYYHHHGGQQISRATAPMALSHWRVQRKYLRSHPATESQLGPARVRRITTGELLEKGYAAYWKRDLNAAREIFRVVMHQRYGTLKDWIHMLPCWLPHSMQTWMLARRDNRPSAPDPDRHAP